MNFCHAIFRHKELPEANQIASQRGSHGEAKRAVLPHQVSSSHAKRSHWSQSECSNNGRDAHF